jgi:flagellar protein FlaI
MIFKKDSPKFAVEMESRGGENVLHFNYLNVGRIPNIAENAEDMAVLVNALIDNPGATRAVFVQQRNYNYDSREVFLLSEIARLYNFLTKNENVLNPEKLSLFGGNVQDLYNELSYYLDLMKQDPVGCYIEIKRNVLELRRYLERDKQSRVINYVRFLERFKGLLEGTKLIQGFLVSQGIGREYYKEVFRPDILPNFTFTRLVAEFPRDSEFVDQYELDDEGIKIQVSILKVKNDSKYFYHVMPSEYGLNEEQHMLVNLARNVLTEHRPKAEEFTDPERIRKVFFNVSRDLLSELSNSKRIKLSSVELDKLARILVRHTIGFGLIEILLLDEKLQDIVLNAPIAQNSVFVRHSKYDECVTNIIPSYEDADSWAAKLRLQSGRALDEANPVLDTDLILGNTRARIAAVTQPLSPKGLSYAFRRHRDNPWTLPLFIENKMINSLGAGLLSFVIDGARTMLVAGTRSSGKTSLLGSLMLEVMPKARIIVIEDTQELPIDSLRGLGYDILGMKVRSALSSSSTEVEAAEGIRTSLRLGDSALIIGEVRSDEAKALYEAMRVGALANVVAGTIHGDSPYGVYDRVVNDLGVPNTSFKATDLIVITNPIKTADGLYSKKRVVQITEVRKHWDKDPLAEKGFVDLMKYNVEKDELEPTDELINGDSEILKNIASNVKGWAGNWDAIWGDIILRGKIKQEIVEMSDELGKKDLKEARFNSLSNAAFHRISAEVREEGLKGEEFSGLVFDKWKSWALKEAERF